MGVKNLILNTILFAVNGSNGSFENSGKSETGQNTEKSLSL